MISPDSPAPKKGPSRLAVASIGCGVLLLIVIVGVVMMFGFFARKMKDTVGENAKGEDASVDARSGSDGSQIVVKGPNGEAAIGGPLAAPPAWVPAYPAAQTQSGGMKMEKAESIAGAFTAQTPDATAKVKAFFESKLKTDGFEIETTTANTDGNDSAVITGHKDDGKRTITVLINAEKGTTSLVINYEGPKQ